MRRRIITFFVVALVTAMSTTAWLYDGDLGEAIQPVLRPQAGIVPAAAEVPAPLGEPAGD